MWSEEAVEKLRKMGHKITPQRLELIRVLERIGREHPSLKNVHDELLKKFPTMSFSTLYSNVLLLRELGLIELFSLGGETHVEVNTRPHINVISRNGIEDVDDLMLIELIEKKTGRKVKLVNVIVE